MYAQGLCRIWDRRVWHSSEHDGRVLACERARHCVSLWAGVWGLGALATNGLAWLILGDSPPEKWRILAYCVAAFPTVALAGVFTIVPESPRWLLEKKRLCQSRKTGA